MGRHWTGRAAWAEIDLDHIRYNASRLCRLLRGGAELLAVVKGNAYGHGADATAQAALEGGAARVGVACVEEGVALRAAGVRAPILVLGHIAHTEAADVAIHRLTPMVASRQLALALSAEAARRGERLPVHVKVDTGMARYGVRPEEAVPFVRFVGSLPGLLLDGVYTHFASADLADKAQTRRQWRAFLAVLEALRRAEIAVDCRHCANSAATLDLPETHLDLVRCGLALYGLHPSASVRRVGLRPALELKSRIARVCSLGAGAAVGYGGDWVAPRPSRIGLVPIGYADGVPRLLSNRGAVLVRGRRAPIVGRVAMNCLTVDVSEIEAARVDDEVTLLGRQGDEEISADEVAGWAETINYEILAGLADRLPRLFLSGGVVVEATTLRGSVPVARPRLAG